jgi:hypothetical protein
MSATVLSYYSGRGGEGGGSPAENASPRPSRVTPRTSDRDGTLTAAAHKPFPFPLPCRRRRVPPSKAHAVPAAAGSFLPGAGASRGGRGWRRCDIVRGARSAVVPLPCWSAWVPTGVGPLGSGDAAAVRLVVTGGTA